jgi:NTP pyrophosphatase (non-canonical NTP hydrolase)
MDFNEYQEKTKETWISNKRNFIRIVLGICGESGEIAEKIKKFYRDGHSNLKKDIKKELGDLLYYIAQMANQLELNLENIAKFNIEKLKSRKERNKIKGSGDER